MMSVFYVLIALYLMFVGARMTGIWASNTVLEGALLLLAGLFLFLAQIVPFIHR